VTGRAIVCAAVAAALAAAPTLAQSSWTVCGAVARVRVVGPAPAWLEGPRAHAELPSGRHEVHFAADAEGQPRSLSFEVEDGDAVQIAIAPAAAERTTAVPTVDPGWQQHDGEWIVRTRERADDALQRVRLVTKVGAGTTGHGIVLRWRSPEQWSRCVFDRAAGELRIERCLGGTVTVMARQALVVDEHEHDLTAQIDGFRVQAWFDGVPMLQCFDGGSAPGAVGYCYRGEPPSEPQLALAEIALPRASAALVSRRGGGAQLHAALSWSPGSTYVVEFGLDRPGPLLPQPDGLESLVLQRPAGPRVLLADFRGTFGANTIGEVGLDGRVALHLPLPTGPGLAGRVVLVRLLAVGRGDGIFDRSPPVAWHW
jgi:hypothetical protein